MVHRRLLVYSEIQAAAATMQIRIVSPLGQQGFQLVDAHGFPNLTSRSRPRLSELFDAVIVHRGIRKRCAIYPALIAAAREEQLPVILDTDDLLFQVPRTHPDFAVYQARTARVMKVLLDADTVVASTQPLADQVSAFHSSVVVIPNELPPALWRDVCRLSHDRRWARMNDDQITIGYIGSETHRPDLQSIEDVLLAVLRRHRGRVKLLSVGVPLSPRLRHEPNVRQIKPGKRIAHNYPSFVSFAESLPIDIGVAPLLDNAFNCCKSNVKFQEYAALGIAGVYSNLPTYQMGLRHGDNGFLAKSAAEWEECLEKLVTSAALRKRLAKSAADDLESTWHQAAAGGLWNETITNAAEQARHRSANSGHPIASIVDEIYDYQSRLERQLTQSIRYQAGKLFARFMKKWAA